MSRSFFLRRLSMIVVCCIILAFSSSVCSAERFPYMGTITGNRVNVRAGSSMNHEILCNLNKGDRVAVRDERGGWLKIVPPPPVKVWIWSKFVKDDVVLRDSVNVRARPHLRSSVLCQVEKGESVRPTEWQGEWLATAPPANCYVWVSAEYVKFASPIVPRVEDESEKLFQRCETRHRAFDRNEAGAGEKLDNLIDDYKRIIAGDPKSRIGRQAKVRVGELEKIKKEMEEAAEKRPAIVKKPAQRCLATGILRRLDKPVNGASHQLLGKRLFIKKVMCYLKAPRIDLDVYVGKKVTVSGRLLEGGKEGVPVVEVGNISLN